MNKVKLVVLSLLFVSASHILSTDANAQCVQCSTQGRKFICAPSSTGGRGCVTNSTGTSCGVSSPCGSGRIGTQVDSTRISLSESLVRDIKTTAPHLAAALAFISKNKELLADGSATVYLMPSEIMAGSDAQAADPAKDSVHALLERLDEPPSNEAPAVPIVYEIAIEAERGSSAAILRIQMTTATGESSTSLLEVNLAKSRGKWKGIGWQAR